MQFSTYCDNKTIQKVHTNAELMSVSEFEVFLKQKFSPLLTSFSLLNQKLVDKVTYSPGGLVLYFQDNITFEFEVLFDSTDHDE